MAELISRRDPTFVVMFLAVALTMRILLDTSQPSVKHLKHPKLSRPVPLQPRQPSRSRSLRVAQTTNVLHLEQTWQGKLTRSRYPRKRRRMSRRRQRRRLTRRTLRGWMLESAGETAEASSTTWRSYVRRRPPRLFHQTGEVQRFLPGDAGGRHRRLRHYSREGP